MNDVLATALSTLTLLSCSVNLPEPGMPNVSSKSTSAHAGGVSPAAFTAHAVYQAATRARAVCQTVKDSIPKQKLSLTNREYNRKQAGLLVTTLVGVAGSVVTAVLANDEDQSGNESDTAAIVGASTAGATTLAGVVSLFVVGSGTEDDQALLARRESEIDAELTKLGECVQINTDNINTCRSEAFLAHTRCLNIASDLPYKVNGGLYPAALPSYQPGGDRSRST